MEKLNNINYADYPSNNLISLNVKTKLRTYRKFFGLKQSEIAKIVGKSVSIITAWERNYYDADKGPIIKPSYRDLVILRDLYQVPLDQLFRWEHPEQDQTPALNKPLLNPDIYSNYPSKDFIEFIVRSKLKAYRQKFSISQYQLAHEVHKSISTIAAWERIKDNSNKGPSFNPDYKDLVYLSKKYGITLEELFKLPASTSQ